MEPSRSAVDRAGKRIRKRSQVGLAPLEEDLAIVAAFRSLFIPGFSLLERMLKLTVEKLTTVLAPEIDVTEEALNIAYRPKTSDAIVAKLCRSTTSLSTMQDIAGGRIVVPTVATQEGVTSGFIQGIAGATGSRPSVKDTTEHGDELGYRAVHIVFQFGGRPVEIQIRTARQQQWAQTVENVDQSLGTDLKHGNGPEEWLEWLLELSKGLREQDLGLSAELPLPPSEL
ncbi:MAG TPA: RelA/SpoT domain-containing protein [Gaiellaceae bacterium]|nr:RelA/SpoT domain-containing protein [Gaiellaceae bacterium]